MWNVVTGWRGKGRGKGEISQECEGQAGKKYCCKELRPAQAPFLHDRLVLLSRPSFSDPMGFVERHPDPCRPQHPRPRFVDTGWEHTDHSPIALFMRA
jgi:hypothetical protein